MQLLNSLLNEVNQLGFPRNQFAIFGSGPLAIRNLRVANDIDLIVKEILWNTLSNRFTVINDKLIRIGLIEIYKDWKPWFDDVDILIDSADIIDNYRFVKLSYLLKWKKEMGREKDQEDIQIINEYLNK